MEKVRVLNVDILQIRKQELLERLTEVFTPEIRGRFFDPFLNKG